MGCVAQFTFTSTAAAPPPAANHCHAPACAASPRGTRPRKRGNSRSDHPWSKLHPAKPHPSRGMRLCLPARMGGGGKTPIDALARASGHSPPHGGDDWGLGTRGQGPWRSPTRIAAAIRTRTAPLHGAKQPDALRAGQVGQRASGNERGKSACGSAQERRALRSMATGHAGQSASSRNSRSASNRS